MKSAPNIDEILYMDSLKMNENWIPMHHCRPKDPQRCLFLVQEDVKCYGYESGSPHLDQRVFLGLFCEGDHGPEIGLDGVRNGLRPSDILAWQPSPFSSDCDVVEKVTKGSEALTSVEKEIKLIKELASSNKKVIELLVGMVNFLRKEMEELKNGREKELDQRSDQETRGSES